VSNDNSKKQSDERKYYHKYTMSANFSTYIRKYEARPGKNS